MLVMERLYVFCWERPIPIQRNPPEFIDQENCRVLRICYWRT